MSGDEIIRGAFAVAMIYKDNEARVDLQASGRSVKRSSGAITSAEEVHLRRLWWFDVEGRSSRCCGFGGFGWEWRSRNSLSFFEVLTKRLEHAALVQGCGGMQQGEEDKVFQVERLAENLCNSHLPFQQRLRGYQFRTSFPMVAWLILDCACFTSRRTTERPSVPLLIRVQRSLGGEVGLEMGE